MLSRVICNSASSGLRGSARRTARLKRIAAAAVPTMSESSFHNTANSAASDSFTGARSEDDEVSVLATTCSLLGTELRCGGPRTKLMVVSSGKWRLALGEGRPVRRCDCCAGLPHRDLPRHQGLDVASGKAVGNSCSVETLRLAGTVG